MFEVTTEASGQQVWLMKTVFRGSRRGLFFSSVAEMEKSMWWKDSASSCGISSSTPSHTSTLFWICTLFWMWRVKESNFRMMSQRYKHVFLSPPSPAADLLVNTLCLPFTLVYTLQGEWKFGSTLCFMLPYAQGLAVHVSTVTLNVIALDRHRWVGLKDGGWRWLFLLLFFALLFCFVITKVEEICFICNIFFITSSFRESGVCV